MKLNASSICVYFFSLQIYVSEWNVARFNVYLCEEPQSLQIRDKQQDKPPWVANSESTELFQRPQACNLSGSTPQGKKIIGGLHRTKERLSSRISQILAEASTNPRSVHLRDLQGLGCPHTNTNTCMGSNLLHFTETNKPETKVIRFEDVLPLVPSIFSKLHHGWVIKARRCVCFWVSDCRKWWRAKRESGVAVKWMDCKNGGWVWVREIRVTCHIIESEWLMVYGYMMLY